MASPTNVRARYPRSKPKQADIGEFLPYLSNLANAFRRVPKPMSPAFVDPVRAGRISLSGTRRQIDEASRAADLSTEGYDSQTGAALRVGNMANRLRALTDVNQQEANTNQQYANQANIINSQINAQNVGIQNAYQDDLVQSRIAQTREQSENLANFSDKVTASIVRKDQIKLENDRAKVLSRMYDRGLYDRFTSQLKGKGVDIPGYEEEEVDNLEKLAKKLRGNTLKKYAAGGMMKVLGGDDPGLPSQKKGVGTMTLYKPKDTVKKIFIQDKRTLSPTTGRPLVNKRSINADPENIATIVSHAKAKNVDPYTALAISYQESEIGNRDSNYGMVNSYSPDQDVSDRYYTIDERTKHENANMLAKALKDKSAYASRLGYRDDDMVIQAYNGYGKVKPMQGENTKAFYGIPVSPTNPLDMRKNPAYGKTVRSLRDSVLKLNPEIQRMVKNTPAYSGTRRYGGKMNIKYSC